MADPYHPHTVDLPPVADTSEDGSTLAFQPPPPEAFDATHTGAGAARPMGAAPKPAGLPGYEILDELGRGGMGVVYLARQVRLNRAVALKMILGGGHASANDLIRFVAEAEAAAAVSHPGIVQVYESGHHDGLPYFALEYCSGGTLAKKLDGTPLPAPEAARLLEQIAGAVQAAHDKGIVHRDLKPANILFGQDGTPKVADFGLARRGDSGSGLTVTGAIMGTPSYMAPEQARGAKGIGPATDVYSLGTILYECLTGRPPFRAASPLETVLQVQKDEPVSPSQLVPKLPRDLETVCLKSLQKDPAKRYKSAAAFADDLNRYLTGEPITARRVSAIERAWKTAKRHPGVTIGAAVTFLALALTVVVVLVSLLQVAAANVRLQAEQATANNERRAAELAREDADAQRAKAQTRLKTAVEAVDKMMVRVAGERWARRPELREERKKVLLEAVAFFQGLSKEDSSDPQVRRETVNANMRVASAFTAIGDSRAALDHLNKALETQRLIVAAAPGGQEELSELASVLHQVATAELLLARYEAADRGYKEAVRVARDAVELGHGAPAPRVTLVECLTSYSHFLTRSDTATASQILGETIRVARQLIAEGAKSYSVRLSLALGLAATCAWDASNGRFAEAGRALAECEELIGQLAREDPPAARLADLRDSTRMQILAVKSLMMARAGKHAEAIKYNRDAIAIADDLLTFQPSYFPWLLQRLTRRIQIGESYYHLGQLAEAEKVLAEADVAEKALLAAYPQHVWIPAQSSMLRSFLLIERVRRGGVQNLRAEAATLVQRAQNGPTTTVRYNIACAYSWASVRDAERERDGWANGAVEELTKLREDKYFAAPRQVAHLDNDPDLEPIRRRPEYQAFRRTLSAEVAPPPRAR